MRSQFRVLLILLVLTVVAAGYVWYLDHRGPSADIVSPEQIQSLTTGAELRGTPENPATLENVTVEDDGTIHLAPAP